MKVSKEQVALNRARLIETAARLIREHGIHGVGVAEIGRASGMTHGALYAHFPSKEALVAAALDFASKQGHREPVGQCKDRNQALKELLDAYLSEEKRDNYAEGCAMAASVSEIGRQDLSVKQSFTVAFNRMANQISSKLDRSVPTRQRREQALAITAALIGAISASRAVMEANPELSSEILHAARNGANALAGASGKEVRKRTPKERG